MQAMQENEPASWIVCLELIIHMLLVSLLSSPLLLFDTAKLHTYFSLKYIFIL